MDDKQFVDENTIIELTPGYEDTLFDDDKVINVQEISDSKIKVKTKKKKTHKGLSKKTKIIIAVTVVLLVLVAVGILVYFLVFAKEDEEPQKVVENIVIEKDNYIYDNGVLKILGDDDSVVGSYECVSKNDKKCYVAYVTSEDLLDVPKYVYENGTEVKKRSRIYNNQYIFIYDDSKISLYDLVNSSSDGSYEEIKVNDSNYVVFKDDSEKYGVLEISDEVKTVIEPAYDNISLTDIENTLVAKEGNYTYLLSFKGSRISPKIYGEIRKLNDEYISVYDEGYLLYDYEGALVFEDEYDYIDFEDEYIFVINNKKIFGYDSELFKLNEEAIKTKNDEYNKTYVFDENNNLVETKTSYTVNVYTKDIVFEFHDETTKSINLTELAINKATDYVSYYNGMLYFYKDLEKTEMLGKYDCNNENKVDLQDNEYKNCFVAKDSNIMNSPETLGYIPIINEQYVFINDTKTGATRPTIVLYDLSKESSLVKYQAVDTGMGLEKVNYIDAKNPLIYAKNMDGNYGVITITSEKAQGVIAFKDDNYGGATKKIAILDEYFLITREVGNYLYNKTGGSKPVASSQFEIVKYQDGYMVVKNNKYLVYKMQSSTSGNIISNELDYVELYKDFFVGINDKKLNVYDYNNGKEKLLSDDLDILVSDYSDSYKFVKHSDCYQISIKKDDNVMLEFKYNIEDWSRITNEIPEE